MVGEAGLGIAAARYPAAFPAAAADLPPEAASLTREYPAPGPQPPPQSGERFFILRDPARGCLCRERTAGWAKRSEAQLERTGEE